jgi:L-seryl-tRNA(Ser) seleniumtransferase
MPHLETSSTAPNYEVFRQLPSIDELLRTVELDALICKYGRLSVLEAVRLELSGLRTRISGGALNSVTLDSELNALPVAVERRVAQSTTCSLRRVVNASGVLIHTNLGRAPLSRLAVERIAEICAGYSNLEFDLDTGERGQRNIHSQSLFARLFARQGIDHTLTTVVNNNAAAVLLALAALADGGEVIVSRGELVEIGGSFRIPDIMARSGAVLREVGTTNRTRIADYENAITDRTRLLLRVHRSNFEIVGFTEQPSLEELVELGRRRGIAVMEDLGSGGLVDLPAFGIHGEPSVFESLRAGVSLVTYSGDKLLGGPQAGLITGEPALVEQVCKHPLFRALRVDKLCYAALEGTLLSYVREEYDDVPLLRMMRMPPEQLRSRCQALADSAASLSAQVIPAQTMIGGGAAPGRSLPGFAVAILCHNVSADELARRLRNLPVPVVTRVEDGRVLLDLRTVDPADDAYLANALAGIN